MSIESQKDKRADRIINEYKTPNQKFIDEKVENMIVFFGSARSPSASEAETLKKSITSILVWDPDYNKGARVRLFSLLRLIREQIIFPEET